MSSLSLWSEYSALNNWYPQQPKSSDRSTNNSLSSFPRRPRRTCDVMWCSRLDQRDLLLAESRDCMLYRHVKKLKRNIKKKRDKEQQRIRELEKTLIASWRRSLKKKEEKRESKKVGKICISGQFVMWLLSRQLEIPIPGPNLGVFPRCSYLLYILYSLAYVEVRMWCTPYKLTRLNPQ